MRMRCSQGDRVRKQTDQSVNETVKTWNKGTIIQLVVALSRVRDV